MPTLISVHSFRGGTGKSNMTANLAAQLALQGKRVAVVDTDIQSPGVHVLFGLEPTAMHHTLNDYLWGNCAISACLHDVSGVLPAGRTAGGSLQLVPASMATADIARILRDGYSAAQLNAGIQELMTQQQLDFLLIDTHPGVNEETLLSIAISDTLLLVVRPDQQDFQGTAVTVELARRLDVPDLAVVVSKALPNMDYARLQERVHSTFGAPVLGILPLSEEMVYYGSGGVFSVTYPEHPYSRVIGQIAHRLLTHSTAN